ncbi:MAG: chloride channel protein [Moraxellaceae bacterium]|nr:MAG: chloride channel protein [Moraxellaceae bacterium]
MPRIELDKFRDKLANIDALPLLSGLGIIAGFLSGAMILLFRWVTEELQASYLQGDPENFESLPTIWHFLLPLLGGMALGLMFHHVPQGLRRTGIALVIERFTHQQGNMSLKGLLVQFAGAVITLASGHSMGREGPAVHIGSATSSLLAQWASLPNNSMRVLVGCGCASAIAASFNTPIAGVIFAMEVVMLEYSISTFTPIILASVTGAVMTRAVYGHEEAFIVPTLQISTLLEIPYIMLLAIVMGCLAACFIWLSRQVSRHTQHIPIGLRFTLVGAAGGLIALITPEIMGVGYDTVNAALIGHLSLTTLLLITFTKLIATSLFAGSGIPGGFIGPAIFMGATAGAAMGLIGLELVPSSNSSSSLYAMLGLAGMMSAVLQAPLAALMALLELTSNPNIIFPGMLVVVIASMVSSEVFKQTSIFRALLMEQGVELKISALSQHLHRTAVPATMERSFTRAKRELTFPEARELVAQRHEWIIIGIECKIHNPISTIICMKI